MTDDGFDFGELLRSPYDPDPDRKRSREGEAEVPWKPAVIAAVLGALVASAFVIYAIVTGPTEDVEAAPGTSTSTTEPAIEFVPSTGLPAGYVEVAPNVGMRSEWLDVSATGIRVGVSSVVSGGQDPDLIDNPDIAYWELDASGTTEKMSSQTLEIAAIGNLTVEFPVLAAVRDPMLLAYPAEGTRGTVETRVFDADASVVGPLEFEINGTTIIVDQLTIGDVYAHVAWHVVEGGLPATIDTIVTFVGTDNPSTDEPDETLLVSPHLTGLLQGFGIPPLEPRFGFSRSEQLVRIGEPVGTGNEASAISVEFAITIPASIGDPIRIPIGAAS